MPWEIFFGRATDGIRQERYISVNSKSVFHMGSIGGGLDQFIHEFSSLELMSNEFQNWFNEMQWVYRGFGGV